MASRGRFSCSTLNTAQRSRQRGCCDGMREWWSVRSLVAPKPDAASSGSSAEVAPRASPGALHTWMQSDATSCIQPCWDIQCRKLMIGSSVFHFRTMWPNVDSVQVFWGAVEMLHVAYMRCPQTRPADSSLPLQRACSILFALHFTACACLAAYR